MKEAYDHCNWPDDRLLRRSLLLEQLTAVPHSDERAAEIQHELNCIAFEVGRRVVDKVVVTEVRGV